MMRKNLWIAAALFAGAAFAGGGDPEQHGPPQAPIDTKGVATELWALASQESKLMGLLAAAGIGAAIGFMTLLRVWKPKPNPARYTVVGQLQVAYDDWLLLMQRAAVTSALVLTFGLEMVFLDTRYGWGAKVTVAVVPALIAAALVRPVYNRIHEYLNKRKRRKDAPGEPDTGDDLTRL